MVPNWGAFTAVPLSPFLPRFYPARALGFYRWAGLFLCIATNRLLFRGRGGGQEPDGLAAGMHAWPEGTKKMVVGEKGFSLVPVRRGSWNLPA
ncbi:hypothetical protein BX600DRAFT_32483 [Xylariales sp. PMI_506]|nr:hypothetical protein BX600DRAFT_32483 [Xylariales sp. PMI_506]